MTQKRASTSYINPQNNQYEVHPHDLNFSAVHSSVSAMQSKNAWAVCGMQPVSINCCTCYITRHVSLLLMGMLLGLL
jgi:hypothetical protein